MFSKDINILVFLIVFALTGCGSIQVHEEGNNIKRIELRAKGVAFPREALYTAEESQFDMRVSALQQCPSGYKKIKEQYLPDDGTGQDMLLWLIKCE